MKITNIYDLPEPFANACSAFQRNYDNSLDGAYYAVSELIKPPLMRRLQKEYDSEISEDITDRLWALSGQAMHSILEAGAPDNSLTEERMSILIDGVRISGKPDLYLPNGELWDYKESTVWKWIYKDYSEWEKQLNIYAYILQANGFEVKSLKIAVKFSDWSKRKAKTDSNYPKSKAMVIPINFWSPEKAMLYIEERIFLHQSSEDMEIKDIPICTKKERWAKDDSFAVMKEGRKTAIRVFSSMAEANSYYESISKEQKGCYIEERFGENTRCIDYCNCVDFCPYKKSVLKE